MTRHLKHTYAGRHTHIVIKKHNSSIYALNEVYLHIMQIICLNIVKYPFASQQPSQAQSNQ